MKTFKFDLIAINTAVGDSAKTISNVIGKLQYAEELWGGNEPEPVDNKMLMSPKKIIMNTDFELAVTGREVNRKDELQFLVSISSDKIESLAPIRDKLGFELWKEFDHLYVLHDDVSKEWTKKLQEKTYEVEASLRRYLQKWGLLVAGPNWIVDHFKTDQAALNQIKSNIGKSRKLDSFANKDDELYIYGMTVHELGTLVTEKGLRNVSIKELENQIQTANADDGDRAIEALKSLQGTVRKNIDTHFESLGKADFPNFWSSFNRHRNQIAHGRLLTKDDYDDLEEATDQILAILLKAEEELDKKDNIADIQKEFEELKKDEKKESLEPAASLEAGLTMERLISDVSFELGNLAYGKKFLGLRYFRDKVMVDRKGYSFLDVDGILTKAIRDGKLEVHHEPNPYSDHEVAALRLPVG